MKPVRPVPARHCVPVENEARGSNGVRPTIPACTRRWVIFAPGHVGRPVRRCGHRQRGQLALVPYCWGHRWSRSFCLGNSTELPALGWRLISGHLNSLTRVYIDAQLSCQVRRGSGYSGVRMSWCSEHAGHAHQQPASGVRLRASALLQSQRGLKPGYATDDTRTYAAPLHSIAIIGAHNIYRP